MGPRWYETLHLSHVSGAFSPLLTGAAQAFCFLDIQEKVAYRVLSVEDETILGEF